MAPGEASRVIATAEDRTLPDIGVALARATSVQVLERLPDPVLVVRQGKVTFANPAMARLLGYEKGSELVGREAANLLHHDDFLLEQERQLFATGGGANGAPLELRMRHAHGSFVSVELSAGLFAAGAEVIVVVRDLSHRDRLGNSVKAAEHFALSSLAAGLANEINNPLGYLLTNLEFAADELRATRALVEALRRDRAGVPTERLLQREYALNAVADALHDATAGGNRIGRIVQAMRGASAGEVQELRPLDLNTALEAALDVVGEELRTRAKLVRAPRQAAPIRGDLRRLTQAFIHLFSNAIHAIPEGTALANEIEVRCGVDDAGRAFAEIHDTGGGISPQVRDRMSDPFFTSREHDGPRLGLGISMVRALASELRGELTLERRQPRGTVARLTFPVLGGPAVTPRAPKDRRAKILIVDDEVPACNALTRILEDHYDVESTTHPAEALARIRAGETFDLILCDEVMPGLPGSELYRRLQEHAPAQAERLIFVTGGAKTSQAQNFLTASGRPKIDKPYRREALLSVIALWLS